MNDFDTLQKLPNNVGYLGKIIVATGFKWLHKVQKINQSGHTGRMFWWAGRYVFYTKACVELNLLKTIDDIGSNYTTKFYMFYVVKI